MLLICAALICINSRLLPGCLAEPSVQDCEDEVFKDTKILEPEQTLAKLRLLNLKYEELPESERAIIDYSDKVKKLINLAEFEPENCHSSIRLSFPEVFIDDLTNVQRFTVFYQQLLADKCLALKRSELEELDRESSESQRRLLVELTKRFVAEHYYEQLDELNINDVFIPNLSGAIAQLMLNHEPNLETSDRSVYGEHYQHLLGDFCGKIYDRMLDIIRFYQPIMTPHNLSKLENKLSEISISWLTYGSLCISLEKEKEMFVGKSFEIWKNMKKDGFKVPDIDLDSDDFVYKPRPKEDDEVKKSEMGFFRRLLCLF